MVLTMHNRYERKKAPHIFIDRWLAKVTDQFIANSWAVKNFTAVQEGIPAHRFEVIYNGVGLSRFDRVGDTSAVRGKLGIKQDELLVGSIGRLVEQKGYQYLIEAAGMLREDRPDVRFVIVGGEGHPSESVKGTLVKQVKELGLETTVIFAGVWRDIPQILVAFDLFVLPSLWEGFGIALVEAMAMRKAIVATRVDAIPEVVEDGISGLLVPPRDSKALAAAIAELLDDPFRRKQMGAAGRWRVESRFTSQIMTKKLESLYESLARDKIRWNGSSLS
jgi:glycosyltransferase involved in cell wall biosynthesis